MESSQETTRTCTKCKKELPLDMFYADYEETSSGKLRHRTKCIGCMKMAAGSRKNKKAAAEEQDNTNKHETLEVFPNQTTFDDFIVKSEEAAPYEVSQLHTSDILTQEDIESLKELLAFKSQLIGLLKADHNNAITDTITANKADRIKKTYNMDPDIVKALNKYSGDTGVSQSDVINLALRAYLVTDK